MEKMTKRDYFEMIKEVAVGTENEVVIVEFCDAQIEQLEKRAEKAKERAAAKKTESDEMTAAIGAVLTNEPQTAEDILEAIVSQYPEATKAKVVARMTDLIAKGVANKEQVTFETENGKVKRMTYTVCAE